MAYPQPLGPLCGGCVVWRRVAFLSFAVLVASCATQPASSPAAAPKAAPVLPQPKPTPVPTAAGERPANAWTTNDAGLAIIKQAEGLKLSAYQLGGQWLIGFGHAKHVTPGMTITQAQAEQFLKEDVGLCEGTVTTSVTVPITRNEFSAMVSLCYNIGPQTFSRSSLVSKLNQADRAGAADAFLDWDKGTVGGVKQAVPYLTARRQKERTLFLDRTTLTS